MTTTKNAIANLESRIKAIASSHPRGTLGFSVKVNNARSDAEAVLIALGAPLDVAFKLTSEALRRAYAG